VPFQRYVGCENEDPIIGRYWIAKVNRYFQGLVQAGSGGAISGRFFHRKLHFAGFEKIGHQKSLARRGRVATCVPRIRTLAQLSAPFCGAFRVFGDCRLWHHSSNRRQG
jgi:hypothetical protein